MPSSKEAIKDYNLDLIDKASLSPITVTANSTIADELLSPKSVNIYSKEEIMRSGATNLLDFFKYNTEFQAEPSFGNMINPKLSMRGFGNGDGYQNISIIVDGVSLNQIDMVSQQLGAVPINTVEKIEVAKSSGSVLYGDNAGAGTVILRTNTLFDRDRFYGSLRSGFGTYNTKMEHINLGSVNEINGFKILADGNFSYLDMEGKKPVQPDGTRDTTENLNGKATLGLQKDNLEVLTSFMKDDANVIYTGSMTLDEFKRNPDASVVNGRLNIVHNENWVTSLKYKINDNFNLAYTYANKTRDSKFPDPFFPFLPHYEGEDHRLTLQTLQDDFNLLIGFDHNDNLRLSDGDMTGKKHIGAFISGDYFVNDRLSLNAGFRQSFITFSQDNALKNEHLSKSVNPNSYNFGVNYSLAKSDAVFANYSHSYQTPDIDRFFTVVFSPDFTIKTTIFNRFINTMNMDTYSIGYKHIEDDLRVKAEFYYADLTNEIYLHNIPIGNDFFGRNTNFDTSSKYGVELSLYKDFGWLYGNVNYVFTDTRANLGSQAFQISAQPKHIVLTTIGKEFTSTWLPLPYQTISLSHKFQSQSYAQDDFDNSLGKQQEYNATSVNYQLSDHKHWTVDFSVQNLFDVANGQFIDFGRNNVVVYPTNYQRTFQGSVSYRF